MRGPLFARPNLKWLLITALLVIIVDQLTTAVRSEPPQLSAQIVNPNYRASDEEIHKMVTYAIEHPSVEAYTRVAVCYQNRGQLRKALLFLREADKAGQLYPED